jgi:pimeloyl-ACP methyl ester carboxylesterase
VFEPAACAFPAPEGTSPECGYLVVPENRSRPDSPAIRLHLAIFRSTTPDPAPDPVVHLAGGPGSSSLAVAQYLFARGLGEILERRDLILIDQRGTGYSQPRLDCPERQELTAALLDGSLAPEEKQPAILAAFRSCRAELEKAGIDLSAYTSADSAADLNDLRLALGYPELNLYGVSYGSRLALTLMRDHPEAVRSAVLDSVYPPQAHLYTSLAPNAQRAFEVFFGYCASDAGCAAAYPDLEEVFYSLVDEFNASPVRVSFYAYGAERSVELDGGLLVDVLFAGLYNPAVTASMPAMIYEVKRGSTDRLQERLALYFDPSSALGMNMAVQCNEEIPFSPPEEAFILAGSLDPAIAAFFPDSVQALFAVCQEWGLAVKPGENDPVSSAVPALVLAGELDPITPPEWGRQAASSLENAYYFEFPANGHWVTRSSPCALELALAFWENPAAPDPTCTRSPGRLHFTY